VVGGVEVGGGSGLFVGVSGGLKAGGGGGLLI
jgi:hypothetical protein